MARRSSGIPTVLLLAILLALFFLYARRSRNPFQGPPRSQRASRYYRRRDADAYGVFRTEQPHGRSERRKEERTTCEAFGIVCESRYLRLWNPPGRSSCHVQTRNGYPVPDPVCTPGGINPSVTEATLRDPAWRTSCLRNCQSSEAAKHDAYAWYGIREPRSNFGETQVCELDHLVPLELGGADGLGNIWPQCGPSATTLEDRYFKKKDRVEDYLAEQVKAGRMSLAAAQHGIARDWTEYLDAANRYCESAGRC